MIKQVVSDAIVSQDVGVDDEKLLASWGSGEALVAPDSGDCVVASSGQDWQVVDSVRKDVAYHIGVAVLYPCYRGGQLENDHGEFQTVDLETRRIVHGRRGALTECGAPDDLEPKP